MNNIYEDLRNKLAEYDRAAIVTTITGGVAVKELYANDTFFTEAPEIVKNALESGQPVFERHENGDIRIVEPFFKLERAVIFGGGHISLALAEFVSRIGFYTVVVDDREEFANSKRFPWADEVICAPFTETVEKLGISDTDYIMLVTRGHEQESSILKALYKEALPKYIGMIGSKTRIRGLKDVLAAEGLNREWLDRVHNPIGLSIGARTPEEIAISIAAEVIQVRRMPSGNGQKPVSTDIEMEVINELAEGNIKQGLKRAVVTLIETKGSTPRKAGAKMIVYEDGTAYGTVGGGEEEAIIRELALEVIKDGRPQIKELDISDKAAVKQGILCGGKMTYLVEAE